MKIKAFNTLLKTMFTVQEEYLAKLVGKNKKSYDLVQAEVKKMANSFTLEYWLDEEWYVGRLKEAPGVFSQGETLKELKANILDAYKMMIKEEPQMQHPKSMTRNLSNIFIIRLLKKTLMIIKRSKSKLMKKFQIFY